jgi:hypothetical protein
MEKHLSVKDLKTEADDLSIKWNAADQDGLLLLRKEIGNSLNRILDIIEKETGKRYRPVAEVDNL